MYVCYNFSGEPRNTYLLETQIPIANTTKCKQLYEKNNIVIDSRIVICAGPPEGRKDACRVISFFICL